MSETTTPREPTMLDQQIRALYEVHARHLSHDGPLDDERRFAVIRLYVQWINEALDDEVRRRDQSSANVTPGANDA